MAFRWTGRLLTPVIVRAAREIVARLGQPTFMLGPDWRIVMANKDAYEAFALEPDLTIGQRIFDLADGDWDVPALRDLLDHDLAGRDVVQHRPFEHEFAGIGRRVFQLTVVRLRGNWFDTGLTLLAFQDETDRARAEMQLAGLLEGAPDAMVVVNEAGVIQLVNRQAVSLFGYARDELLSQQIELLVPDVVRGLHPGHRAGYLAEPQIRPMGANLELAARRRDGSEFPVDIALSPVETDDGLLVVAAVRDISERRKGERERAELESQLRDAQRMESVGRLAGGIAHDFNNVLTVIRGHAELTLIDMPLGSPARSDLEQINSAAGHGAELTNKLLALSRRQVIQPIVLDLNGVVGELAPMLRRLLGDDIELATGLEANLWLVKADPGQLEQVIINLAINARDAMPSGGQLTIETTNVEFDDEYVRYHAGVVPGNHVQLAVTDSGLGIDAKILGQIFEPFFTTKEPGQGTGLGLATVYGIVKQSGGSVRVYSEPGRGSTFRVYLPRADGVPELERPAEAALPLVGGSESILVVEDDDRVRALLRAVLERYGYRVVEASNAEDAMESAANQPPFDLLVTDLMMPRMNGRELAETLGATNPDLRTLYISGYAEDAVVHQGILDPGVQFLAKPFSPDVLVRKVRDILGDAGAP
jgi:PAS domain S-box-containing protein